MSRAMQQVKQNVLIADDLLLQFRSVVGRITHAMASQQDSDLSSLRGESERLYAGIWEHLDVAATQSRSAGRSTDAYAAIRATADRSVGVTNAHADVVGVQHKTNVDIYTVEAKTSFNAKGIEAAAQASAALKATWPDVDWTPPAPMPDVDLRPRGLLSRLFGRR